MKPVFRPGVAVPEALARSGARCVHRARHLRVKGRIWFWIGPAVCWKNGRSARSAGAGRLGARDQASCSAGPDCSARSLALVSAPLVSWSVPGSS